MVVGELIEAFQEKHPEIRRVFYETLPPGLERKQILAGGAILGDTAIDVLPDIYTSVSEMDSEKAREIYRLHGFIPHAKLFL